MALFLSGKASLTKAYQLARSGKMKEAKVIINNIVTQQRHEGERLQQLAQQLDGYHEALRQLLGVKDQATLERHTAQALDLLKDCLDTITDIAENEHSEE